MYRGTTPNITFNINTELDLTEIAEVWVTFKSGIGDVEKTYDSSDVFIDAEHKKITVVMTQEDTLSFGQGQVYVQIRMRMNDDLAYASDVKGMTMNGILRDGEI